MRYASGEPLKEVELYLKELKTEASLSNEEEYELYKRNAEGDEAARNKLIQHNLRFVVFIAKDYIGRGVPFPDLIAEGNMGLIYATKKFDYTKGFKFISYAVWWIRHYIQVYIQKTISRKEGSDEGEFDAEKVDAARCPLNDEDICEEAEELISCKESAGGVTENLLKTLSDKERRVIEMFYGLHGEEEQTLTEISKNINMSTERVRQIVSDGIDKMRFAALSDNDFNTIALARWSASSC